MYEEDAKQQIEERLAAGGSLQLALRADLPSTKKLLDQCLAADIPAVLGPCHAGG
jgi:hypothetical protein